MRSAQPSDEAGQENTESLGAIGDGKYRLFASLGRGGMADVLLAVAHGPMGFDKLVVVKRLRSNLTEDPACVAMFLDEARLAARLNHPNVVHTFEVGEQKGVYFIAMEYLEGQSLHKIAKTARDAGVAVRPAVWARVVADALNGLHYAHELADYDGTPLHVIHRDVSPQNVFVTYGGTVKLVDFGIAKAVLNATQTETGVLKGKVAYMAPEQALGDQMDRRADIFSMGVVFWELLAQKRLVTGDAPAALHKILSMEFPRLREVAPEVPAELDAIVMRAIERDPAKRYQTAQAMRVELESWLRKSGEYIEEDEVGNLVMSLFKEHRAEVKARIGKYMSNRQHGSLPDLSIMSGTHTATVSTGSSREVVIVDDGSKRSVVRAAPHAPSGSRQKIVFAAIVLGIIAIAASSFSIFPRGSSTTKPATTGAASTTAPAASVQLTIRASPENTTLYLDDAMLPGNPFTGSFAKDGVEHHLRATAPSYVAETRNVWLDANATIELSLQPAAASEAESASAGTAHPAPRGGGPYRAPPPATTQTTTPHSRPTLDTNVWGQ